MRDEFEPFLARSRSAGAPVARFVEREVRGYLECGVLAYGFLRVHCDACGHDRLVAFSCKGRGFCPSCGGRRMAETAAHLVGCVLPEVPVRQWVLTLPYPLRYRCAWNARLTSEVLRFGQDGQDGTSSQFIQKNHIAAIDLTYDTTPTWTIGGKYAYRSMAGCST